MPPYVTWISDCYIKTDGSMTSQLWLKPWPLPCHHSSSQPPTLTHPIPSPKSLPITWWSSGACLCLTAPHRPAGHWLLSRDQGSHRPEALRSLLTSLQVNAQAPTSLAGSAHACQSLWPRLRTSERPSLVVGQSYNHQPKRGLGRVWRSAASRYRSGPPPTRSWSWQLGPCHRPSHHHPHHRPLWPSFLFLNFLAIFFYFLLKHHPHHHLSDPGKRLRPEFGPYTTFSHESLIP